VIDPAKLRLTTLSENTAAWLGVLAEWGLSILVEADGQNILLDTGLSISVAHNADALGVNLATVDKVVLSHGHVDHTGGLRSVLTKARREMEIIGHPGIWGPKYAKPRDAERYRYRGIPFPREELEGLGASFALTPGPTWLSEDIVASGQVPMITDYEAIDDTLFLKEGDGFRPDPVADDQSLFLKTELGLVIVLGCAHRGVINHVRYAQELTGMEMVHAVVGGAHLFHASERQMEETIAELKGLGVQRLGVSHCTGMAAAARLAQEFGEGFFYNNAGNVVTFA